MRFLQNILVHGGDRNGIWGKIMRRDHACHKFRHDRIHFRYRSVRPKHHGGIPHEYASFLPGQQVIQTAAIGKGAVFADGGIEAFFLSVRKE